jgi:hypothetical protein
MTHRIAVNSAMAAARDPTVTLPRAHRLILLILAFILLSAAGILAMPYFGQDPLAIFAPLSQHRLQRERQEALDRAYEERQRREQAELERQEAVRREQEERQRQDQAERERRGERDAAVDRWQNSPVGEFKWSVQNSTSATLRLHFKSLDRENWFWPGNDQSWTVLPGQRLSFDLSGKVGERICYGAFAENGPKTWGVGRSGSESCTSCCGTVGAGPANINLVE